VEITERLRGNGIYTGRYISVLCGAVYTRTGRERRKQSYYRESGAPLKTLAATGGVRAAIVDKMFRAIREAADISFLLCSRSLRLETRACLARKRGVGRRGTCTHTHGV